MGRFMLVQTKYQNCGLSAWLARACALVALTQTPAWAQPVTSAPAQAVEATGPARFVLQADGTLVPVAGSAPASSTPAAPERSGNAPSTVPNTAVQAGATIADPDSTPAARAVAAARNAMNAKQFAQLASFVPQARGDVLAMYPEYWSLRTQLGSTHMPGVQQTLTEFIDKNKGAYLADRLKGEWILAAARTGDFGSVRDLGDVSNPNPQVLCAQLEARHMGGQRASAAEAIKVFAPYGACIKLFDQLVADRVLGSAELMPYLYEAIENNKLPDARRYAAWVFEPAELAAYDAMIRDPVPWLNTQTGQRSSARNDIVAMGLARAARVELSQA